MHLGTDPCTYFFVGIEQTTIADSHPRYHLPLCVPVNAGLCWLVQQLFDFLIDVPVVIRNCLRGHGAKFWLQDVQRAMKMPRGDDPNG